MSYAKVLVSSFMTYAKVLVRPDDPGTDRGSLCFQACSSVLLVHPKGGRPGDARVVTSCTSVVLGYAGSIRYDRAPRCEWGRRQVVTALSVWCNSCVALSEFPDVEYSTFATVVLWDKINNDTLTLRVKCCNGISMRLWIHL